MTIAYTDCNDCFAVLGGPNWSFFFDTLHTLSSNVALYYESMPVGYAEMGLAHKSWQYSTQKIMNFLKF